MTAVRSTLCLFLGLLGMALVVVGSMLAGHLGVEVQYTLGGGFCFFLAFVLAVGPGSRRRQ